MAHLTVDPNPTTPWDSYDVARDRVTIVQHDEPGQKGPNYDWDVTCTRESSNPGPIPQTMPVQAEDPD